MMFYIGRNDGFYMYVQQDMISLRTIKWLIPEDLHNNEIVKSQINSKPFGSELKIIDIVSNFCIHKASSSKEIAPALIKRLKSIEKARYSLISSNIKVV